MERVKRHKVWVVWLLLAVFALPFAAKTAHIYHTANHEEHGCSDKSQSSHHDCNNCPVCQFTLSSFTEATFIDYDFRTIISDFEPAISFQNKPYQQVLFSYGLRAPPAV
jgi:hypothetical protein